MKTISYLKRKISTLEVDIKNLKHELINIKGKRGEEYRVQREEINYKIYEKQGEIRDLKDQIWDTKRIYKIIGWSLLHILWITVMIVGIVLMVRYSYEKGLYIFTETHDLVSTFKGGESLVSVDIYDHLFSLKVWGTTLTIVGLTFEIITGMVNLFIEG